MVNNTNQSNTDGLNLLLPKLKRSAVEQGDQAGQWQIQEATAFDNVASSLDYEAPGEIKKISSIPTMWARPLSFEMALHDENYPVRESAIAQWQGMLAAIALAEVRGYHQKLKAKIVKLDKELDQKQDPFAKALFDLLPDPVNCLYGYPNDPQRNPWQDIYVFTWNGQSVVGMTSPSTMVVPSEEGNWIGLEWWDQNTKQLQAPHSYLNITERELLWLWLDSLRRELGNLGNQPQANNRATNRIGGLINEFRDSLLDRQPQQSLQLSDNPQFFGTALNIGILSVLNQPVTTPPQESNVALRSSTDQEQKDLIIYDPDIAESWNELPQNVWVYQDRTLASLRPEDFPTFQEQWRNEVNLIAPDELFLSDFWFIDLENALPGAIFPQNGTPIIFQGKQITPLIPLNPILLDYLTPEDLVNRLQIQPGDRGSQVKIILDLPLSGFNNESTRNYRIDKCFQIQENNKISDIDTTVLEVWPHFQTQGWQEYYGFYYSAEDTFTVKFSNVTRTHEFEEAGGFFQLVKLNEHPTHIEYYYKEDYSLLGLMILEPPPTIQSRTQWTVGVDFGTSFTNVYVNNVNTNTNPRPLPLESLHLQITKSDVERREPALAEYFVPLNFGSIEKPLPIASILTTKGNSNDEERNPIFNGRIYIPDLSGDLPIDEEVQKEYIKTNLKWSSDSYRHTELFLRHLALHVSAIAAWNEVYEIQWSLSFPSAFSRRDRSNYIQVWQDLTHFLNQTTGIQNLRPEDIRNDRYFRTESLAIAQYFRNNQEVRNLVNSTCTYIDMGGGTSDISIWERRQLKHQCSVQLAGRDLFSNFLRLNPAFVEQHLSSQSINFGNLEHPAAFNAAIDVSLRLYGDEWLGRQVELSEQPEFRGLIRLTAIGYAGLYYYIGILLRVLYERGCYSRPEITPVYIGGNGSRLLNWLAARGQFDRNSEFNNLLSRMLSKGTALYNSPDEEGQCFEDTNTITRLSPRPKDEVACGLVLIEPRDSENPQPEPIIAGEDYQVNGNPFNWDSNLEFASGGDNVEEFCIPRLERLPRFLYDFHAALRELRIEGIRRLPEDTYTYSRDIEANSDLWEATERELENMCIEIQGNPIDIREEPPFILGLKALLTVLGRNWADQ